ncbi:MAG TPA: hypothetical protein VFF52_09740 [Isosphaeraceae bacterium]|nr:hypothetical protein [Isosphaeraceae bacterium]
MSRRESQLLRTRIRIRSAWELLGFRSVSDLLGSLRLLSLMVAFFVFLLGFTVVSEKVPWIPWIAVSLVVAVEVRNLRRRRGSCVPAWLEDARWYYTEIGGEESADPVSVFDATGRDEISSESPGTLCLRLEPRHLASPRVRVLDADGREQGIIRRAGLVPGARYAMHRNGELVWMLSVRSILRRHHALELAHGDSWTFDTPFFWWQNLTGAARGAPRLLGGLVVPTMRVWAMWIEPGWDTFDLLAAVAFMHRQYWHW